MWKAGSEPRLLTPLQLDPRDPGDPRDPAENSETSIFDDPSVDFGHFACGAPPKIASRRLWSQSEALGELWEGLGSLFSEKIDYFVC